MATSAGNRVLCSIEVELINATGIARRDNESDQTWRARLVMAQDEMADKLFDGLSVATKEWCKAAVPMHNRGFKLPDFSHYLESEEEADTPRPKRGPAMSAPHRMKNQTEKGKPATERAKEIMLDNRFDIPNKIIHALLLEEGYTVSLGMVEQCRASIRQTLRILKVKHLLKPGYNPFAKKPGRKPSPKKESVKKRVPK